TFAAKVDKAGGTMSADPTVALGVATKRYVDGRAKGIARKNASNQSVAANTDTKVTLGTALLNEVGTFASNRWTPPAGPVLISASSDIAGTTASGLYLSSMFIAKNGVAAATSAAFVSKDETVSASATLYDRANGTDYYELFVFSDVAASIIAGRTLFTGVTL